MRNALVVVEVCWAALASEQVLLPILIFFFKLKFEKKKNFNNLIWCEATKGQFASVAEYSNSDCLKNKPVTGQSRACYLGLMGCWSDILTLVDDASYVSNSIRKGHLNAYSVGGSGVLLGLWNLLSFTRSLESHSMANH